MRQRRSMGHRLGKVRPNMRQAFPLACRDCGLEVRVRRRRWEWHRSIVSPVVGDSHRPSGGVALPPCPGRPGSPGDLDALEQLVLPTRAERLRRLRRGRA
jgi:hypothetical protein